MLLPYDRTCPDCQQRREASLTLESPPPKVLLVRYSWSISFPANEKDVTFCGVPEIVGAEKACDVAAAERSELVGDGRVPLEVGAGAE